jgi:hypothetical protein
MHLNPSAPRGARQSADALAHSRPARRHYRAWLTGWARTRTPAVRRDRLARDDIHPVSSDLGAAIAPDWQLRLMFSDQVGTVGFAVGLTMMIISRKH